ncbi:MAG: AAA family ATPase [Solirubrobacteraceae bacterium]
MNAAVAIPVLTAINGEEPAQVNSITFTALCPKCSMGELTIVDSPSHRPFCDRGCHPSDIEATLRPYIARDGAPSAAPSLAAPPRPKRVAVDGASFALDTPGETPAVWGEGDRVLWAEGEALLIAATTGLGKTAIAQQVLLARTGIAEPRLLDLPIAQEENRTLYIAADRPKQAARSLGRMVEESDRKALSERLVVWPGPLPFNLLEEPARLAEFVADHGAGTVVIDSLKDVALDLEKPETGARVNLAFQLLATSGVELLVLHHQRKSTAANTQPRTISDVYGSGWLTAGAGSVVSLIGEPGDLIVELRHLKQPAADVGPLTLMHDHEHGRTSLHQSVDLHGLVQRSGREGMAVDVVARHVFGVAEPDRNKREKARRRLERMVSEGRLERVDEGPGKPVVYRVRELRSVA